MYVNRKFTLHFRTGEAVWITADCTEPAIIQATRDLFYIYIEELDPSAFENILNCLWTLAIKCWKFCNSLDSKTSFSLIGVFRCGLWAGEDPPHPRDRPLQAVQRHCGWDGHHWCGGSFQEVRRMTYFLDIYRPRLKGSQAWECSNMVFIWGKIILLQSTYSTLLLTVFQNIPYMLRLVSYLPLSHYFMEAHFHQLGEKSIL